jgi:hypothetical protein
MIRNIITFLCFTCLYCGCKVANKHQRKQSNFIDRVYIGSVKINEFDDTVKYYCDYLILTKNGAAFITTKECDTEDTLSISDSFSLMGKYSIYESNEIKVDLNMSEVGYLLNHTYTGMITEEIINLTLIRKFILPKGIILLDTSYCEFKLYK